MRTIFKAMVAAVVVVVATSNLLGEEAQQDGALSPAVAELWKEMHEAGMLSDAEYQHALQHGTLPSNGERAPEAASTASERRTPNRERLQLSPAARREQVRARLDVFATRMHEKYTPKRAAARDRAAALGLPLREDQPEGCVAALDYYDEHGFPQVNQTESAVSADTISTDEVWPAGGKGFTLVGEPITLGVWDGGAVRATHTEFGSRIDQQDDAMSVYGISDHATAVAGTMTSAGSYYARFAR